jgi:hypothetical protein
MSCLDATFTLTPLSPLYNDPLNSENWAFLECHGADFWFYTGENLSSACASNRFFFDASYASDPNLNYALYTNRQKARILEFGFNLTGYAGANKQLVLIFGFDVQTSWQQGRVLVYTDAGPLPQNPHQLIYGDNQFVLEIDSLDQVFYLYFIHAGGWWFFRGLSGYVV